MYLIIGSILFLFFGIGSLVTQYINKQSKVQQANERWLKLVLYFVILIMVFSCIYFELTVSLAICIGIIGLFEISKAHIFSNKRIIFFFFSVFIYLTILFAFIKFSDNTLTENVCFVYFTVVTFDGFSQLTGQLFGKRKLLPQISPNKTFEGLLGGLILTTSSSFFFFQYIDFSIGQTIATAISICFTALTGDLLASLLKRKYQIKDYSKLIPGHGGILDRFDSFIFSGAMYWLADLFKEIL